MFILLLLMQGWTKQVIFNWPAPNGGDVTLADLDGDGDLDIAACATDMYDDYPYLYVFWNEGFRNFTPEAMPRGAAGLATGDLDGDGDMDIVLSREEYIVWYENPSWSEHLLDQAYGSYAMDVEVADVDGDGDLDIIQSRESVNSSSPMKLFENQGGGSFVAWDIAYHSRADGVAIADYDGDLDLDIAVVSGRPDWPGKGISVYVRANNYTWGDYFLSGNPDDYDDWYIAAGDVNGDGRPDFLTPWPRIYINQGGLSFMPVDLDNWGHGLSMRFRGGCDLADIDRDGDLDAIIQAGSENMTQPRVVVFYNNGASAPTADTVDLTHTPYISGIKAASMNPQEDDCVDIVANGAYQLVIYWCVPLDAPEEENATKIRIIPGIGSFSLLLPYPAMVRVYDATGRLLMIRDCPAGKEAFSLSPGVYIIRAGNETLRVAVP
ncbi:MAG: VCBS repeat-containing protein [candidate division WOR-3 bacterium]